VQPVSAQDGDKPRALFLAGHRALDFLNTRVRVDGDLVDLLTCDEDVLAWLREAGIRAPQIEWRPGALVDSAHRLREGFRSLLEDQKEGRRPDPSILNEFLAVCQSHPRLVQERSKRMKVETVWRQTTVESILAPLAEAAADLIATADLGLVRRCESESCVLWFQDQTKSHRRRWCSMESCGNRHKVHAYRARRRGQPQP
jgi:predicted RNA-binding Zn ribbon-like protein